MTSEQAVKLLERYRNKSATPQEVQLVETWYLQLEGTGQWQWGEGEKEAVQAVMQAGLLRSIQKGQAVHRIHFLKTAWFRYAAAILLLFGTGAYLYYNTTTKAPVAGIIKPTSGENDIVPGGNKAVLTLADGTTIILDSASNGALVQQGHTKILKLNAGMLAYNPDAVQSGEGEKILYNTITTPKGGQYQIMLPDGTKIWLNAASSITFPTAFIGNERRVEVKGEVYFEVATNARQPFFVKTNEVEVQVLGTSFNINAYQDESSLKTTLVEGSVKVHHGSKALVLQPGEQALVNGDNVNKENVNVSREVAWKNGYFEFYDASIETIMRQLARWYNLEVIYKGEVKERFVTNLPRSASIAEVLNVLELTRAVHFKTEGNIITVMP